MNELHKLFIRFPVLTTFLAVIHISVSTSGTKQHSRQTIGEFGILPTFALRDYRREHPLLGVAKSL
ncbi:hypothetical protein [Candidatus Enterovibrio escicola]|uniref:hypothetical protein n=1 Tax=Candidatus Enterovibrio escicola TaxID=1927127 RepID=UPI001237A7FD|nr:hypothetical protein [Candidatus Enterovibrio escacola]